MIPWTISNIHRVLAIELSLIRTVYTHLISIRIDMLQMLTFCDSIKAFRWLYFCPESMEMCMMSNPLRTVQAMKMAYKNRPTFHFTKMIWKRKTISSDWISKIPHTKWIWLIFYLSYKHLPYQSHKQCHKEQPLLLRYRCMAHLSHRLKSSGMYKMHESSLLLWQMSHRLRSKRILYHCLNYNNHHRRSVQQQSPIHLLLLDLMQLVIKKKISENWKCRRFLLKRISSTLKWFSFGSNSYRSIQYMCQFWAHSFFSGHWWSFFSVHRDFQFWSTFCSTSIRFKSWFHFTNFVYTAKYLDFLNESKMVAAFARYRFNQAFIEKLKCDAPIICFKMIS